MTLLDYTEADALAEAALLLPCLNPQRDHGARYDGIKGTDGVMSAGQATFTSPSTNFGAKHVGMVMVVGGAGAAGADFVSPIVSVSGHVATLAANASTPVSGALFCYGTDDSAANKATFADVAGEIAAGRSCNVFFPPGISINNGSFDEPTDAGANALLKYPWTNVVTVAPTTLRLIGSCYPPRARWGGHQPPAMSGTVLFFTKTGTGTHPCGLGAQSLTSFGWSGVTLAIENLTFMVLNGAPIHAVQASQSNLIWRNAAVETFNFTDTVADPRTNAKGGLIAPARGNPAMSSVIGLYTHGFNYGVLGGEHLDVSHSHAEQCAIAAYINDGGQTVHFSRFTVQNCPRVLETFGGVTITVDNLSIETSNPNTPAWCAPNPLGEFKAPDATGYVNYRLQDFGGSGDFVRPITVEGNTSVRLRNLGRLSPKPLLARKGGAGLAFINARSGIGGATGAFTVAFWIKANSLTGTPNSYVFGDGNSGDATPQWAVIYGFVAGTVEVYSPQSSGNARTGSQIALPDTGWHHVAYRRAASGSAEWAMFLDGVKTVINASINVSLGVAANLNRFTLFDSSASGNGFPGALQDVGFWNRALTDAEILQLVAGVWATDLPNIANRANNWRVFDPGATLADGWGANTLGVSGTLPQTTGQQILST
jgi:hypothetical protein